MEIVNGIFNGIKKNLTIENIIFFILIPFILTFIYISVHFFPTLRDILILQPLNPTPISIFFSSYTHLTFGHLLNNLRSYIIIILLILVLETDRKIFFINMLLIFFILPIIISSYIIYYAPNSLPGSGFSGIISGLIGYLSYSVYRYIIKKWNISLTNNFLYLIILFNMLTIFIIYKLFYSFIWYFTIVFLSILAIAYTIRTDLARIIEKLKYLFIEYKKTSIKNISSIKNLFVFVFSISFVFGASFELFPSNIITEDGKVNILVHFIGYIFGTLVPLMFVDNLMQKIRKASMVMT